MSETTTNLELFKYNPNTDGDQTFNIDNALNNNFDKLDTVIGALANLTTEQKTNLVAAINEIITNLDEKSSIDLDNLSSIGQGILDAKIEAEALTAQNGYIKFKLNGISKTILQWGFTENVSAGATVTLPITFNGLGSIQCVRHWAGKNNSTSTNLHVYDTTLSSFKVGKGSNTTDKIYFYWLAIGY